MRRKVVKGPVGIIAAAMGAGVAIFQFYTAGKLAHDVIEGVQTVSFRGQLLVRLSQGFRPLFH